MFDIGFTELLVVGVVALIVVGPKDLPMMFRTLGRFTARARALGREFTSAMNAAADESGMRDVAKDLKGMTSPKSYGLDKLNEAADAFDKWDPTKTEKPEAAAKPVDPERAADIEKIRAATEKAGRAKLDREAAAKAEAAAKPAKAPAKTAPAKKAPAKAPAAKATPAKAPAAKKPATKKPAAKKTGGEEGAGDACHQD
jgi:sec-independent protein translocase protein TatB